MKKLVVVFCCIFILNCAENNEKKSSEFLQNNTIELAPPRIKALRTIIDSSVVVSTTFRMKDASIYFTKNGDEPTENSELYKKSITISEAGIYKFRAFHEDWKPSQTSEIQLFKKGIRPKTVYLNTASSKTYQGKGSMTLFNNKKSKLDFKYPQWIGYDTTAIAEVKFKSETYLKKMTVGYLVDTKSWIFPPDKVSVLINEKDLVSISIPKLEEGDLKKLEALEIPINMIVESLKVEVFNSILPNWHPGANNKAWLFMDEWIFN